MILCCIEPTFLKRTLTFLVRSSLSLGYCLMVMLGGRLFTNESHAQVPCEITVSPHSPSLYSRVVVLTNYLNVRKEPHIDAETVKDDEGNDVQVYDTDMGVVRTDPKWGDKYFAIEIDKLDPEKLRIKHVWYYVRWDSGKEGWSAGIIFGVKHIDTVLEADLKDAIVEALFNCKNNPVYITHDQTNHDYNDYRCNANWKSEGERIYGGKGHAGWDVQTSDKAPVPLYCHRKLGPLPKPRL